jgi:hypothetical protein
MPALSKGSRFAVIAMSLGIVTATSELAAAGTWQKDHPRRAEVNARLNLQNFRINQELKDGKISVGRADALHAKDEFIRKEERFDASMDGSHITASELKSLNQQENGVRGKIP